MVLQNTKKPTPGEVGWNPLMVDAIQALIRWLAKPFSPHPKRS